MRQKSLCGFFFFFGGGNMFQRQESHTCIQDSQNHILKVTSFIPYTFTVFNPICIPSLLELYRWKYLFRLAEERGFICTLYTLHILV